jgi:twitching motility protein PilI
MADLSKSPFQWLQELEQRAKQEAMGLPRQTIVEKIWRGIGFRLQTTYLVTSIDNIREVLTYNEISRSAKVPGAKPWIKGLTNLRGVLLPVIDLNAFFQGKPISLEKQIRMLVINQGGLSAGLLVDEVVGIIKHFPENQRDRNTPCKETWLVDFADGLFREDDITWTVFDMQKLASHELFQNAAL